MIEFLAMITGLIGWIMISKKKRTGFIFSTTSNALWVAFGIIGGHIWLTIFCGFLFFVTIYGYINWKVF